MNINSKHVMIIDIITTMWEKGRKPKETPTEIIALTCAKVDIVSGATLRSANFLINDIGYDLPEYTTQMCGISQEDLDSQGVSFEYACQEIGQMFSDSRYIPCITYGSFVNECIHRKARRVKCRWPFYGNDINLKGIITVLYGLRRDVGLNMAGKIVCDFQFDDRIYAMTNILHAMATHLQSQIVDKMIEDEQEFISNVDVDNTIILTQDTVLV